MTTDKLTNPLTDSELARLIWGLKAEGFHPRLLAGLVELQQSRQANAEIDMAPIKIPPAVFDLIYQECEGFVDCPANPQVIWEACRAAMLKGGAE